MKKRSLKRGISLLTIAALMVGLFNGQDLFVKKLEAAETVEYNAKKVAVNILPAALKNNSDFMGKYVYKEGGFNITSEFKAVSSKNIKNGLKEGEALSTKRNYCHASNNHWEASFAFNFENEDEFKYLIDTGQEIKPLVTVKNGDYILKENIDYTLSWDNNTDVTDKAKVTVKGIGDYTGEHVMEFSITYLDSKDKYEVKGVKGTDDWYQSVAIIPAYGYEIEPAIEIKEGNNNLSFRIRRISDNALSDIIKLDIKKDETKPSGKLILEDNEWSEFNPDVKNIEVHNKTNKITITSADNLSGVSKIEYAISENDAYETENEVQNSKLEWKEYKSDKAIDISINKDTVIYVKITDKAGNVKYINSDLIKYHSQEESTEETTTEETTTGETTTEETTTEETITDETTSVIVPEETSTDEETSSMNNSESITEKEVDQKASEKTTKHSDKKVKTGDEAPIIIWAIVIVICIAGLVVVWKGKKKN